MKFPGFYKTKGVDPKNGKPNIVAAMINEYLGASVEGGSLAPGVLLSFGGDQSFDPTQWEFIAEIESGNQTT